VEPLTTAGDAVRWGTAGAAGVAGREWEEGTLAGGVDWSGSMAVEEDWRSTSRVGEEGVGGRSESVEVEGGAGVRSEERRVGKEC